MNIELKQVSEYIWETATHSTLRRRSV